MARQLSFDLPVRPALGREDFFVSPGNAMAVALLDGWRNWAGGKLVLYGPEGAGKTHLAHVWAGSTHATILNAADLEGADIPALAKNHVAIEDISAIAGNRPLEETMFHLHNLVLAEGNRLLLTDVRPAQVWGLTLPDLQSRMQGAQSIGLKAPDDALLSAVLTKLFADRQLFPSPDTISYLLRHMDRSFSSAIKVVAAIDKTGLEQSRAVNRKLASEVLDKLRSA
ncbi:DnaA ATPase domain-containing protein [Donghicola mangrovi]|uniref:Chromosomal replication initiator DnaA n=1 Tax=Donghicola mangrovi TaxID=2729614 RepID=A0A850QAB0_9RHOB|nr:DnaA/Hda family protein [Donghicola mangrovi]NVO23415.1 chromosomal replication initiator DnaA [Donghicola mangrovi]